MPNNRYSEFCYDRNGLRLYKGSEYKSVDYLFIDDQVIGEQVYNVNGTFQIYYLFDENGEIYGINVNGSNYYFRKNLQGDVVAVWLED